MGLGEMCLRTRRPLWEEHPDFQPHYRRRFYRLNRKQRRQVRIIKDFSRILERLPAVVEQGLTRPRAAGRL